MGLGRGASGLLGLESENANRDGCDRDDQDKGDFRSKGC